MPPDRSANSTLRRPHTSFRHSLSQRDRLRMIRFFPRYLAHASVAPIRLARRRYNERVKIVRIRSAMMKPSIASGSGASVVLRAAIGDITALKTVMRDSTNRAASHCAALLLLDDEPDPRTALHLLSALGDAAPAALARCVMNAPEVWNDARINISARRAATIIKGLHATWLPRMPTNVRAHLVTASAATANTSVLRRRAP